MKQFNPHASPNSDQAFKAICIAAAAIFLIALYLVPTATAANISAFGDSITAGHGSSSGGYPPKLSQLLNSNGKPSAVVNHGLSSETTVGGVARIDSILAGYPADIILIMEGTNDIDSGLSVETTRHNLQAMISKAKGAGVIPVLATLTPTDRNGSSTLIPEVWNPMIASLASSNGVVLADQYSAILASWPSTSADGLHPNEGGYQIIAQTWYSAIAGMISSESGVSGSGGGGGGGGGGCFIATAAFGSPIEKHVALLKEFRDAFLLNNLPGRLFVETYYKLSPSVAAVIDRHDLLKAAVRTLLYPLVGISYFLLKLSLQVQVWCFLVFVALTSLAVLGLRVRKKNH